MRNAPLHESIKAYCKAALRLLQTRFSNLESLPLGSKRRVKITGQTLSVSHYPAVLWNMFVFQSEHDLQQMDAYRAAIEVMQQDERVARHLSALVGTVERRYRVNGDSLLRSVLIELLETQ
jgi:hypothetical protein